MGPLGNDGDHWGKKMTVHSTGHPILLDYWTPPLLKSPFDEHGTQVSLYPSPIWRDLSTYFFPDVFLTNFPITLFSSLYPCSNPLATTHEPVNTRIIWPFFLPNKMHDNMYYPEVLPTVKISPSLVSCRVVPEGFVMLQLSTSGWCLRGMQNLQ